MTTMVAPLLATLALLSTTTVQKRTFQFVPYGQHFEKAEKQPPTISCDGRVHGSTLELSHWTNNQTPQRYYADTSTEMALKLERNLYPDAIILNNHYDTDGVLSVFSCLEPEIAAQHSKLLIAGAEAGDFGEWSSDLGVKLDCALCKLLENEGGDEQQAYDLALKELPTLLEDLENNNGSEYEFLWKTGFEHASQSYSRFLEGEAILSKGPGNIILLNEPSYLSPYAVHRGLMDAGLWKNACRLLRVCGDKVRYEKPGHGWVPKLESRRMIPAADGTKIAKELGKKWQTGGPGELVAICQAVGVDETPESVAHILAIIDKGATW